MKTHTSRWFQNSDTTWILKMRAQDGGYVLAWIAAVLWPTGAFGWCLGPSLKGPLEYAPSFYTAQRRVRKALAG